MLVDEDCGTVVTVMVAEVSGVTFEVSGGVVGGSVMIPLDTAGKEFAYTVKTCQLMVEVFEDLAEDHRFLVEVSLGVAGASEMIADINVGLPEVSEMTVMMTVESVEHLEVLAEISVVVADLFEKVAE